LDQGSVSLTKWLARANYGQQLLNLLWGDDSHWIRLLMKLSTGCADGPFFSAGASRVQVEQARFDSRRRALAERPLTRLLSTLAIGVAGAISGCPERV